MKISYLDGIRFYRGLLAGGKAVIENRAELDRINVFPVADADTGINLTLTMQSILEQARLGASLRDTFRSVADAALVGARGNSGIIFAQYLYGLSRELPEKGVLNPRSFSEGAQRAVKHLYDSLLNPVEGTMLTVIREWSDFLVEQSAKTQDFMHLLTASLEAARRSLMDTPRRLKVLADAGVVDAGASGFVYFLQGVVDFIHKGSLREIGKAAAHVRLEAPPESHGTQPGQNRYCTEAILSGCERGANFVKGVLASHGDSLILAGDREKLHLHIHTARPDKFFEELYRLGQVSGAKIDDMLRQYQISHERRFEIGLITDTASDLPLELLDRYQIIRLPFGLNFGNRTYLDKLNIQPEGFYEMLKSDPHHPTSSQPSPALVRSMVEDTVAHYERSIAVHISSNLSGVYQSVAAMAADSLRGKLGVIDSRQLSVSEGLVTLRVAKAVEAGLSYDEIMASAPEWAKNTRIYTDVHTLKYMVRGGRVPPLAGFVANLLNVKPIVGLNDQGKAKIWGKSFSRAANARKITALIENDLKSFRLWDYAIVHAEAEARAQMYARILEKLTGRPPAYIMPLSPVVGVHNGIGAVAVGVSYDLL